MEFGASREKWQFYQSLRTDELVKQLGVEGKIKALFESIETYALHINEMISHQSENNKTTSAPASDFKDAHNLSALVGNPIFLTTVEAPPSKLDFRDVQSISYRVGTYVNPGGIVGRLLFRENPLDPVLRSYFGHYVNFIKTNKLFFDYLEDETLVHVKNVLNQDAGEEIRANSMDNLFINSVEHLNRQSELARLSHLGQNLGDYYTRQTKTALKEQNWDWFVTNNQLSPWQIARLRKYFQRQAKINGVLFKTTHLAWLRFQGASYSPRRTEEFHSKVIEGYKSGIYFQLRPKESL